MRLTSLLLMAALANGCSKDAATSVPELPDRYADVNPALGGRVLEEEGRVFIFDRDNKAWDVTGSDKYGLDPSRFTYGLGQYAIQPLLLPEMLHLGDPGYPAKGDEVMVLGVDLFGFARAYPTWVLLSEFEVANEVFGDAHLAVAF